MSPMPYTRMAGFGNNPTMSFERMVSPTVSAASQPGAVLGTFPSRRQTGGTKNYTFVPLR